jgi:hypothetical protein
MSTDPALNLLNPDQLLASLIEMEGVIEQQKVALNALDDERNGLKIERDHFKGAFEEADAAAGIGDPAAPACAVRPQVRTHRSRAVPTYLGEGRAGGRRRQGRLGGSSKRRRGPSAPARRNLGHDQIVEHIPELQDEIAGLRSAAAEALAPVEPDSNAPDADETDDGTFPGDKPNLSDA